MSHFAVSFPWLPILALISLVSGETNAGTIVEETRFGVQISSVFCADVSPDGRRILVGGSSQGGDKIDLYDLETGLQILRLDGGKTDGQDVKFFSDGKRAVSCGRETIKVWDLETGQEIRRLVGHHGISSSYVRCVALSPDEKTLASGGDDLTLRLWDLETGKEIWKTPTHDMPRCVRFSPDGSRILAGGRPGVMQMWNAQSGEPIQRFEVSQADLNSLAVSPDGRFAMSSYVNNPVVLWDMRKLREVKRFGLKGNPWFTGEMRDVKCLVYSPSGDTALFGIGNGDLILWDVLKWEEIARTAAHGDSLEYFAGFLPDGERSVTVGKSKQRDERYQVCVWNLPETTVSTLERSSKDESPAPTRTPHPNLEIEFKDRNLERVLRAIIGKTTETICVSDFHGVTILNATREGIESIEDIQYCLNLESLSLARNKVCDLDPLSTLKELQRLDLSNNLFDDIEPLGDLTGLCWLDLSTNNIKYLSPLAGLQQLEYLNLSENFIEDIGPLASLKALSVLLLDHNEIEEVDALYGTLGPGDTISVKENPLSFTSRALRLRGLESIGVKVLR